MSLQSVRICVTAECRSSGVISSASSTSAMSPSDHSG